MFLLLVLGAACTAETQTGAIPPPPDGGTGAEDAAAVPSCAATDLDGDGFGTDPSCDRADCDDRNPSIHPESFEACNGLDDDCDREIDEELGSGACGIGACRRVADNCRGGRVVACTPGQPVAEVCNNLDDDCNGLVDDGAPGASCGLGACARTAGCSGGVVGACVPGEPAPEVCNRADDNCDGTVDEGFRARVESGTYTLLRGFHPVCDGAGQRMGPDCNAAIHRYCASTGCTNAGFGPLENFGDTSVVACVAAALAEEVPYTELARHHPPCDGTTERIGPSCNAAIHRYCVSRGFGSGFGPGESAPDAALVTCLAPGAAVVINTTYTELVGHHGGCDGGGGRYGPDCNAAIHRLCTSRGHTTGYGPVENSGDVAVVTCVSP